MDPYLQLAEKAVENYLKERKIIQPPSNLPPRMLQERKGVFVSIYKKKEQGGEKELRGCLGTFLPTTKNIAEEIIKNAIASATKDYRFEPLKKEELKDLIYSVDILEEPRLVKDFKELDCKKYGLLVISGSKSGLLLPKLEGIQTPFQQFIIACQKAGIDPQKEPFRLYKFEVERHQEN